MGILDKLFGKKKKDNLSPETKKVIEEAQAYGKKVMEEMGSITFDRDYDYKKVQADIRARSLASAKKAGVEHLVLSERQTESHAETLNITEFFPVDNKTFIVFDLETTGLQYTGAEIVEIGAVKVVNGQITEEYSQLISPDNPIPADASAVNHITNDMLIGKPKIYEALPQFLSFAGDNVLAAHNVKFDYQFLANACMLNFFKAPERLFDTMLLARYYPESDSKKLTALAEAAGVELETAHRALSDARMTAKLILATNEKRKKKK